MGAREPLGRESGASEMSNRMSPDSWASSGKGRRTEHPALTSADFPTEAERSRRIRRERH